MRNAPWDADDREVLRQKWRMANETASQCELLLHKVELLRIRGDHVAEQTPEHDELAVEARNMFIAVGQNLLESGLTMADWKWFVENRIPDEPDRWQELGEHWQQAKKLKDLFHRLEKFVRAISKAKRKFADAIKLSLDAWEEADDSQASWYQRVDEGVCIHGKLVEIRRKDANVLEFLCKRTSRNSTYDDLATLSDTWTDGVNSIHTPTEVSTKKNIRSCLGRINNALRTAFNLTKEQEPIKLVGRGMGWKLQKGLLQENSQ
jgi:hypothetical protein